MKSIKKYLFRNLKNIFYLIGIQELHDIIMDTRYHEILNKSENPLIKSYYPGFSQVDEDSILSNINSRLGNNNSNASQNKFVELGVGNGTQNNTLALLLNGWSGLWFGGQDITVTLNSRIKFKKLWITRESLQNEIISDIKQIVNLKVLSLDLDGNDYWFASDLLEAKVLPDVWIQEYNSNFGPQTKWTIPYDKSHVCKYDSYWGASLAAFVDLFKLHGYFLVACNVTGVNAFFVKEEHKDKFADVPTDINKLFMPSRPWLYKARKNVSSLITMGIDPSPKSF